MYLLMTKHGCTTARALRALLGAQGGYYSHMMRRNHGRVVNWGEGRCPEMNDVLNPGNAVAKAANKLESLRVLQEAGIHVPRFSTNPYDFGDATILGRRRSHTGGTDIRVFDGGHTEGIFSDYFTEFVPSAREFRIHVFRGEVIGSQVKQWEGEGDVPDTPIRNHSRGWVFVPFVRSQPNRSRKDAAVSAVEALGLDFGAVDVLAGTDGNTYVLEVNTAPGLSERFLNLYADAIREWQHDRS